MAATFGRQSLRCFQRAIRHSSHGQISVFNSTNVVIRSHVPSWKSFCRSSNSHAPQYELEVKLSKEAKVTANEKELQENQKLLKDLQNLNASVQNLNVSVQNLNVRLWKSFHLSSNSPTSKDELEVEPTKEAVVTAKEKELLQGNRKLLEDVQNLNVSVQSHLFSNSHAPKDELEVEPAKEAEVTAKEKELLQGNQQLSEDVQNLKKRLLKSFLFSRLYSNFPTSKAEPAKEVVVTGKEKELLQKTQKLSEDVQNLNVRLFKSILVSCLSSNSSAPKDELEAEPAKQAEVTAKEKELQGNQKHSEDVQNLRHKTQNNQPINQNMRIFSSVIDSLSSNSSAPKDELEAELAKEAEVTAKAKELLLGYQKLFEDVKNLNVGVQNLDDSVQRHLLSNSPERYRKRFPLLRKIQKLSEDVQSLDDRISAVNEMTKNKWTPLQREVIELKESDISEILYSLFGHYFIVEFISWTFTLFTISSIVGIFIWILVKFFDWF